MHVSRHIFFSFFFLLIAAFSQPIFAQLGFELDIPKPKPFEERELRAEKTGDKKLNAPRRFFQNLTTHYNYFFNASTKLNEVIDRAKASHKDDYSQLLPFYNYSLEATSQEKQQLDSVIYKSMTGVVMHDLRNDWVDDLYMLWGAAYFLQKEFDSAYQMFQFINWAFAEKEKDGYYKYIGSRMDGNNALSIATEEKQNLLKKIISDPPSRNVALVWLARVFIETNEQAEASSLISTLKNDPLFPSRLHPMLEEVQAYWYYKQGTWDSSAVHLLKALDRARSKQELARWEYLAAQMLEKTGNLAEAQKYYTRSIGHTTDPIMDIYSRLNLVRINKEGGDNYIEKNIGELVKMAKRDKYEDYRDIIYFMAAQMEMERNNPEAAQAFLMKGAKYNNTNQASKNNAFLQIADLAYDQKRYMQASSFYDSIQVSTLDANKLQTVEERKIMLSGIVPHLRSIQLQDSLQKLAALPEDEREAVLKSLARQLRRQQGLGEEDAPPRTNTVPDIFNAAATRGEWYFYNANLKTQGAAQFKQVWGNRPNVDNWRRASDAAAVLRGRDINNTRGNPVAPVENNPTPSYTNLLTTLPLTDVQLRASHDSIRHSLYQSGILYVNDLQDYPSAIAQFERIRRDYPEDASMPDVLFQLYYAYHKNGDVAKAAAVKRQLTEKFGASRQAVILNTGKDPMATGPTPESNREYERIYDLFIEGKFTEAIEARKRADSLYQTSSWQPQLLYIEAVYHVRERRDSIAQSMLRTLVSQAPQSPLAVKAQNLMDVLSRRSQIEAELSRMDLPADTSSARPSVPVVQTPVRNIPVQNNPGTTQNPVTNNQPIQNPPVTGTPPAGTTNRPPRDTSRQQVPPVRSSLYTYKNDVAHYAVVILDKVDVVFGNEAKNAFFRYNRERNAGQPLNLQLVELDADHKLLLIGDFASAQDAAAYVLKVKPVAASEIMPWLKPDKFSFSVISPSNLEVLKNKPDLAVYRKFLDQNLPVKF